MKRGGFVGLLLLAGCSGVGLPAPVPSASVGAYPVVPSMPPGRVDTEAYSFTYPLAWRATVIGDAQADPYGTNVTLDNQQALIGVDFTPYEELDYAAFKQFEQGQEGVKSTTDLTIGGEPGFKVVLSDRSLVCTLHEGHYLEMFFFAGKLDATTLDAGVEAVVSSWTWK